jgi:hypothetical protein
MFKGFVRLGIRPLTPRPRDLYESGRGRFSGSPPTRTCWWPRRTCSSDSSTSNWTGSGRGCDPRGLASVTPRVEVGEGGRALLTGAGAADEPLGCVNAAAHATPAERAAPTRGNNLGDDVRQVKEVVAELALVSGHSPRRSSPSGSASGPERTGGP